MNDFFANISRLGNQEHAVQTISHGGIHKAGLDAKHVHIIPEEAIPESLQIQVESALGRAIYEIALSSTVSGYRGDTNDKTMLLLPQQSAQFVEKDDRASQVRVENFFCLIGIAKSQILVTQVSYCAYHACQIIFGRQVL